MNDQIQMFNSLEEWLDAVTDALLEIPNISKDKKERIRDKRADFYETKLDVVGHM